MVEVYSRNKTKNKRNDWSRTGLNGRSSSTTCAPHGAGYKRKTVPTTSASPLPGI